VPHHAVILGSFANNLEQVTNPLCSRVNSAVYSQWVRKWVVGYIACGLRGKKLTDRTPFEPEWIDCERQNDRLEKLIMRCRVLLNKWAAVGGERRLMDVAASHFLCVACSTAKSPMPSIVIPQLLLPAGSSIDVDSEKLALCLISRILWNVGNFQKKNTVSRSFNKSLNRSIPVFFIVNMCLELWKSKRE